MDRFKGKYRIESHRLSGWDYSSDGVYFITIVTAGRECVFGEIRSNKMLLNEFGKIASNERYKSFEIRQELLLDEFVLMPNHLHAIVVLNGNCDNNFRICGDTRDCDNARDIDCRDARPCVSTPNTPINPDPDQSTNPNPDTSATPQTQSTFQRKPKSISSFVSGYKSAVIHINDNIPYNFQAKRFVFLKNCLPLMYLIAKYFHYNGF
jgi:hypothetical protein